MKNSPNVFLAISTYTYTFTGGEATFPFRPAVYIIESKYDEDKINEILLKNSPNVFLAIRSNNKFIDVEWIDDDTLKVTLDNLDNVYLKVDVFNGIKIEYDEK